MQQPEPPTMIPMAVLRRNRSATAASSSLLTVAPASQPPPPPQPHPNTNNTASVPLLPHPTARTTASSSLHGHSASLPPRLPSAPPSSSLLKRLALSSFRLLVWLLIITCALATATDLYLQALKKPYTASIFLQLFIIGSYALLAVASLLFAISRFMTVRYALTRLPKLYIPISSADGLPRHVQRFLADKLSAATHLVNSAAPEGTLPVADGEWGEPGTPLEGVHFRTATLASLQVLVQHVRTAWPHLAPPPAHGPSRGGGGGVAGFPMRPWLRTLVDHGVIDKRVARLYADVLEAARWGQEPVTVDRYLQAMKVLAVLLTPPRQPQPSASGSSDTPLDTAPPEKGAKVAR